MLSGGDCEPDSTINISLDMTTLINFSKCANSVIRANGNRKNGNIRSAIRIKKFWRRLKSFRKYTISPIKTKGFDTRPYVHLTVDGRLHFALMDSGANKSVIGGALALEVQGRTGYTKCRGNVRTADGQRQNISGVIDLTFIFENRQCSFEFLVIPSIQQDIICGIDFWREFGISITIGSVVSEVNAIDSETDRILLDMDQKRKLDSIIELFPNSERDGLGCTTLVEHNIDTGDARPIKQRYYPISPAREKILCEEIDRMLVLGVIEECPNSPWSSPGVLVVRPGKVRFCVDSRKLNSVTVKDAYPIPNIEGIISRLPPAHCISKVDLKDAFWQIRLDETSRPKTAFTIPNRPLYQFTRMPFGLCNAPQTMCRLMDIVIPYYMKTHVFVYLDDLLIVSKNFDEHLQHLREVAAQFRKAGLTINVGKSCFAITQVKYLGYIVGNGILRVDPDKVSAISEFPAPRSIRQLRQFLGMIGWYRRFIDDYSTHTFPLTELLSKRKYFRWSDDAQKSFELLKQKLCSAPVLIHADFSKPFILQCDASTVGVGAVLAQVDDDGNERPIAFMSQKLNRAQRNYTITELECLAVILAVHKFRAYIEGHDFRVITDHASLKWLMRQKDLSGRLARWALKLQGFNFSIEHRRGKDNVVPDALSRAFEDSISAVELETLPAIDLNSDVFNGKEYSDWRNVVTKTEFPDFKVVDQHIFKRTTFSSDTCDDSNSWKLVVPRELRKDVMYAAHDVPNAAHGGIAKTVERVRRNFYWPRLVTDVKEYVQHCELCKTSKAPTTILRPPMGQMATSERPFQRLYLDLIGPFPRTKKGHIGILIVLDHFSKFTFLKPLRKFISGHIITYLKDEIFNCYGVPEVVITDNGSQFRSKEFEFMLTGYGIGHQLTAVHSPQSNASERVNRSINEALRSYIREDHRQWDMFLGSINCALRNSIHRSIGKSPYQVIFGQNMITHGKDYSVLRKLELLEECDTEITRSDHFALMRDSVQTRLKEAYERNERIYNLRSRERTIDIGQEVFRRNFTQSSVVNNFNAKLAPTGVKAEVVRRVGNLYYELRDCDSGRLGVYHLKDIWT